MTNSFDTISTTELDSVTGAFDAAAAHANGKLWAGRGAAIGVLPGFAVGGFLGMPLSFITAPAGAAVGMAAGGGLGYAAGYLKSTLSR